MEKLLVTGTHTLVGANLVQTLHDRWEIVTVLESPTTSEFARGVACDLDDDTAVAALLAEERPRWLVHCGPASLSAWDADVAQVDPHHEAKIVAGLAQAARATSTRLCVISSDAQFAGPRMFHAEDAVAGASGIVAETARRVEQAVTGGAALVVRTHAFGWAPGGTGSTFAARVHQQLNESIDCPVDPDRYATPILASDLAELLHCGLLASRRGTWHLTGAERTSQRRFAAELAVTLGLTGRQVPLVAPTRAGNRRWIEETSLNTTRSRQHWGASMPMLRESLARFAEQAWNGWREAIELVGADESQYQRAA